MQSPWNKSSASFRRTLFQTRPRPFRDSARLSVALTLNSDSQLLFRFVNSVSCMNLKVVQQRIHLALMPHPILLEWAACRMHPSITTKRLCTSAYWRLGLPWFSMSETLKRFWVWLLSRLRVEEGFYGRRGCWRTHSWLFWPCTRLTLEATQRQNGMIPVCLHCISLWLLLNSSMKNRMASSKLKDMGWDLSHGRARH